MAGLVPAIHVLLAAIGRRKTWMPATSAGMTRREACASRRGCSKGRSGPVPGLHGTNLPFALRDATGFALHPGLVTVANIARQEIPAGHAILIVGRRDRRDRATGSSARIFPGHAAVGAAAPEELTDCGARD